MTAPQKQPDAETDLLFFWVTVVIVVVATLVITLATVHPGMLDPLTDAL